jgi:hypothetical protein
MSAVNQEVSLAGQDNDDIQAEGKQLPEHHPRPGGGVHTPPTCGPSLRVSEEAEVPQATQGIGPLGGVVGTNSPQDTFNKNTIYKGPGIRAIACSLGMEPAVLVVYFA